MQQSIVTESRFPTHADLAFYQSRNLPVWANALAGAERPSVDRVDPIDHVVNAHAALLRHTAGEVAAYNLMTLLRSTVRRKGDVVQMLKELAQRPQCQINPEKRAAFARKWLTRAERKAAQ